MVAIVFVGHDGAEHPVDVKEGMNLMDAATQNGVPGIEGLCGGVCSCATCHCYLPESLQVVVPAMAKDEDIMLDGAIDRDGRSRLGCQIAVTAAFEGVRIDLPAEQG